jgi:hypothetical protein
LNPTGKLYQSGDTRSFASDPVYTGPVTITFDQPVYNVDLFAEPWIFCPTVDVKMYNGATQVVSQTFTPDPSVGGCDQNGMTTAAYVRPTYDGAVTKIVIEAPAVTQKQIINSGGFPETAYFLAYYTVHFYESHVVYCPPFNEPLLDGTGFWDELERNLRKSLADPQRHEFKGIVWKNRSTGTLRFQELVPTASDPYGCWVKAVVPEGTDTEELAAEYHAHPHDNGDVVTCSDMETWQVYQGQVNYSRWGGGSLTDWLTAIAVTQREGHLVPTFVIDTREVHKLNPVTSDTTQFKANATHWLRGPSSCYYR